MRGKKVCYWGLFLLLFSALAGAQEFPKAEYMKPNSEKKKGDVIKGKLRLDKTANEVQFLTEKGTAPEFAVKHGAIKSLLYERAAKPRYAAGLLVAWPLLFTKSKSHYLTIQYTDGSGTGQYAVVKLHKDNFRDVLAAIEAQTGKKVERSEER